MKLIWISSLFLSALAHKDYSSLDQESLDDDSVLLNRDRTQQEDLLVQEEKYDEQRFEVLHGFSSGAFFKRGELVVFRSPANQNIAKVEIQED